MSAIPHVSLHWSSVWLAWIALALVFLPQALALNLGRPDPWPMWLAAVRSLAIFGVWALLTPLALRAVHAWPPFGPARWRNGARLAALALALTVLHLLAMAAVTALAVGGAVDAWRLLLGATVGLGATNLLMVAALFAVGIAQLQFAARRCAERQLADAQLAALRHQLQPHFLFNTLNALAELVHADPARAESLLLRLSALLRRALDGGAAQRIGLREELDFLDDYLAIQQSLLGDRLHIERNIASETLDAAVPPMLLQPLVENALRHGIGPRRATGQLHLRTWREGDTLRIEIRDDGAGATLPLREAIGLGSTRARLAGVYGPAATLAIDTAPGAGFAVRLRLPWSVA